MQTVNWRDAYTVLVVVLCCMHCTSTRPEQVRMPPNYAFARATQPRPVSARVADGQGRSVGTHSPYALCQRSAQPHRAKCVLSMSGHIGQQSQGIAILACRCCGRRWSRRSGTCVIWRATTSPSGLLTASATGAASQSRAERACSLLCSHCATYCGYHRHALSRAPRCRDTLLDACATCTSGFCCCKSQGAAAGDARRSVLARRDAQVPAVPVLLDRPPRALRRLRHRVWLPPQPGHDQHARHRRGAGPPRRRPGAGQLRCPSETQTLSHPFSMPPSLSAPPGARPRQWTLPVFLACCADS